MAADGSAHPEIELEQKYFDVAYDAREARRAALQQVPDQRGLANGKAFAGLKAARQQELESMSAPDQAVAFGRIDTTRDETFYIGFSRILDNEGDPLVVNWQAPIAAAFSRATADDPMGLDRRRAFETDVNTITDIFDTVFGEDEMVVDSGDQLLGALGRRRDGRMRDIVRTIQRAQDEIMRAPMEGLLIVQGGPGTGKTIVGLQRISVLLHNDLGREQDRVLFVGPSPAFMRYVERVLPSLGDHKVLHVDVAALGPNRIRPRSVESAVVAAVKGHAAMASLLVSALRERRRIPNEESEVRFGPRRVVLAGEDIENEAAAVIAGGVPHNIARQALRDRLIRLVVSRVGSHMESEVRSSVEFQNLVDRIWPTFSPQEFLRDLLASERRIAEAGRGLFATDQLALLFRPAQQRIVDEPWTDADIPLLDELQTLLNGTPQSFDHIVVDEAQDLSPMQLRSIARRSRNGSLTVLGDLAQAVGPWSWPSWEDLAAELTDRPTHRLLELDVSYRVPEEILRISAPVFEAADHRIAPVEAAVPGGDEPVFLQSDMDGLIETAILAIQGQASLGRSVGVIVPEPMIDMLGSVLTFKRMEWADGRESLERGVTLVPPLTAKGLEFDSVVVIEPTEIVESAPNGLNLLYVALTRPTRNLTVVYSDDLPESLEPFAPATPDQLPPNIEPETYTIEAVPEAVEPPAAPPRHPSGTTGNGSDGDDIIVRVVAQELARQVRANLVEGRFDSLLSALAEELDLVR